jgi:CheY-like chemotaxis protein
MKGDVAQHLVPTPVPQCDVAQSYHAAGLRTEQTGIFMRKLEETINRSGLWRADVPHFIDEDDGRSEQVRDDGACSNAFVVGCDRSSVVGSVHGAEERRLGTRVAAPRACTPRSVEEGSMARILLAEDDAATRDLVQRALSTDGHEMIVTQDGAEALEKLQATQGVDLLISDVQMPGIDGIELVEKALSALPKLRVILMSGFSDELGRAEHLKGRIARVISKPFTLEQIRSAVKFVLG